ncbi:hypothetical protein OROHE_009751 [Orobanche hederae]
MAKKSKNSQKNGDPNNVSQSNESSNPSMLFKTLFGGTSKQNSACNALFSEDNPFRRKLLEKKLNQELGMPVAAKNGEHESDLGGLDFSEMQQQRKRKKEKIKKGSSNLDTELVEEKSKKLKRDGLKGKERNDNNNLGYESKETLEKDIGHIIENDESVDFSVKSEKKKKKKRKRDEVEAEYEARRFSMVDEIMEPKGDSTVLGEKRKKMDNPEDMMVPKEGFDDEAKLLRTVFVGNLPLKLKKKEIMKEFGKFGEVESVRIRSVPIVDGKTPRKGAVIKKQIDENRDSVHAYIVFKTNESAQASLAHNMAVVGGNHIRVDRACPPRKRLKGGDSPLYDTKRTVFVGNLPFDVKDEEIYKLFSGIKNLENSVEAVRVIRDPGSNLGKGIAYILFKTMEVAKMIVKKHYLKLRDRELRLSHAVSTNPPLKRKLSTSQQHTNSNSYSSKKAAVAASRTPDSGDNKFKGTTNLSYQGLRASKTGSQKVHTKVVFPAKSKHQPATEQKSGHKKRPAVAARKQKVLKAANASQLAGTKRKTSNRTPESAGQKKKAKKLR